MNKILSLTIGIALFVLPEGCKQNSSNDSMGSMKMNRDSSMNAPPAVKPVAMTYTCTMHPQVVSDKPGTCPRCGMNLVPKK